MSRHPSITRRGSAVLCWFTPGRTALAWGNSASIAISVALAFVFGYALTLGPVLRAGVPLRRAAELTVASDTTSIATMELIDNALLLVVPGAMAADISDGLFGGALLAASPSRS